MKKRVDVEKINIRVILIVIILIVLFIALYLVISPKVRLSPAPTPVDLSVARSVLGVVMGSNANAAAWFRGERDYMNDNRGNTYGPIERTALIQALGGQGVIDAVLGQREVLPIVEDEPSPTPTSTSTPSASVNPSYASPSPTATATASPKATATASPSLAKTGTK